MLTKIQKCVARSGLRTARRMELQGRILWLQTELHSNEFQTFVTIPPGCEKNILQSVYPEKLADFLINYHPSRTIDGPALKNMIKLSFRSGPLAEKLRGDSNVNLDDIALESLRSLNTHVRLSSEPKQAKASND